MSFDNMFVTSHGLLFDPFQWIRAFSIVASSSFIVTSFLRWHQLQKSSIKVASNQQESIKFAFNLALLAFQSSIVGVSLSLPIDPGALDEYVHLIAIIALAILSPRQHYRSVSPSNSLIIYLSIRAFLNASTLLLIHGENSMTVQVLRTFLEAGALIAESRSKRDFLLEAYLDIAPEETAGLWSKAAFTWIHPMLSAEKESTFVLESLPQSPRQFDPSILRQKVLRFWDQRARPEHRLTLPLVLAQCLMPDFAIIAATRFMLILFRYAQPLLMSRILQFLAANALSGQSYQSSCMVVIISTVVYVGQAILTSRYQHELNRLKVLTRAILVELLYEKTLNMPAAAHNDYSATTLMSTDADALANVSEMFHEAWAQVLEVIVGMVLLAQQIGWFCIVPLPLIYGCSHMTRYVARNLRPKQLAWNKATQDRINRVISVVGRIKTIKMLGLGNVVRDQISCLRQTEIDASKDMRWVTVLANASANALGLFTPAITIILFAAIGQSNLDAETAYTTLAILLLVTHPANMIMTIVPRAIASLASFQRIQDFVNGPRYHDARGRLQHEETPNLIDASEVAVEFKNVELKSSGAALPILENINLRINHGSIVVCTGPTGAGKSLLGLAITGEVKTSKGSISVVSRRIGLCAQLPWLLGQCIFETITGLSQATGMQNDIWYQQVLDVCCIDDDVLLNPASNGTGSGHARLSGGQRQRVALARAVYQRHDIMVLDDPFSALDQRTQERIVFNLLGPGGLLRNSHTTVFLITSAPAAYSLADRILLLKHGRIEFDGDWSSFRTHASSSSENSFVDVDEAKTDNQKTSELVSVKESKFAISNEQLDIDTRSGDVSVYRYYLQSVGAMNMLALLSCTALYSFFSIFPHYWLKWWTQAGAAKNTFYMLGYLICSTIAWASTSSMLWVNFIRLAPRSGSVLHANLLSTVLDAPLSFFLDKDTGAIVNRFGQDIQVIDRDLPSALAALCTQVLKLLMQCSLLLASQRLLLFALPIYGFLIYIIQKVYLRTARQLRYLDLESRSAVYSSFLETVKGLVTIRAFGWQQQYLSRNTRSLDLSQRAFYLFLCLQRWLNVVLDLAIAVVAIVVIGLAVFYSTKNSSAADVGIALNMVLVTNTTLLRLVESWTTFEVSVGAAARLKELEDRVPNEEQLAIENMVPCNWPSAGSLSLRGVRVCHGIRVILSNANLNVQAGAKVFICGETGSGKSTFLMALLRLCPVQQGSIQVDGVEIAQAAPSIIRKRCFIAVPQDTFFQPDISLRRNIDPMDHHSTEEIMRALQQLHLWSHFQDADSGCHDQDNEDSRVLALPLSCFSPLSAGQTQLLSLVRAVLRARYQVRQGRKPIILLDEPAANLDDEYESLSSRVIEQEFTDKGHTVLMITHSSKDLRERVKPARDVVIRINNGSMSVVA